ncbi:non-homologous end-joining DNA ligase [Nitriliruptor alkaliphilus]|uniref:non-homologous end-joining DNA ligase n=1 Tax=Nitriliruptor alkaliphilus TaxID=427918 RepID=UPI000A9DDBC2|nr:non-homologous end-joining DNA ligase [Nitriliruptor alkaliphilus]
MAGTRTTVRVGERELSVSNLDKVLYPATGTTKAEVLRYYVDVAEVMLPHLAARPVTLKRFPDGVEAEGFFEKRCPSHAPDWLGTVQLGREGREKVVDHCDLAEVAALAWAANLGALELHVTMGAAPDTTVPTAVVFDLDPGAPADVRTCAEVALRIREVLDGLGLTAVAKTSGSKGLQVYVPLHDPSMTYARTRAFSEAVARLLEDRHPDLVVSKQTKTLRPGKVLIDWYQNHLTKTTVCAYSLRARPRPTVSTPLTWDEVGDAVGAEEGALVHDLDSVRERVAEHGDLFGEVATLEQDLPRIG